MAEINSPLSGVFENMYPVKGIKPSVTQAKPGIGPARRLSATCGTRLRQRPGLCGGRNNGPAPGTANAER